MTMIKLSNANKRYRKNRKNELHVLRDVELTFPAKGLVAVVGASGSGKTTLLNVLSGMDAVDSGTIEIGDVSMKRYRTRVFDTLRTEHIGMVFQNYYLLEDRTVHENIALTLRLIGFDDEKAIDARVAHVLETVRMQKYAPRLAGQLSGGQQQRVAIARALAKDPAVLLADEPTGNLDSRNTLDIMNILRGIADSRLVVLVTHERDLATHFAARIVEIEDGRIVSDSMPTAKGDYQQRSESDIYLRDLPVRTELSAENPVLKYYGDEALSEQADVRLVYKNGTLYVSVQNQPLKKIVVLGKDSDVHLLDASEADAKAVEKDAKTFALEPLEKPGKRRFSKPFYNLAAIFKDTLGAVVSAPRGRKFVYLAFVFGAMVVANATSNLFNILTIDEASVLTMPRNTIVLNDVDIDDYEALMSLADLSSISAVRLAHRGEANLTLPDLYVPFGYNRGIAYFSVSFVPVSTLKDGDIGVGNLPATPFEIVIDRAFAERVVLRQYMVRVFDFTRPEDLLDMTFVLDLGNDVEVPVVIVGIADTKTPVVYAEEALIAAVFENELRYGRTGMDRLERFLPFELFADDIRIVAGATIAGPGEMLIPVGYDSDGAAPVVGDTVERYGRTFTVVGVYELPEGDGVLPLTRAVIPLTDLQHLYFARTTAYDTERYVYATDTSAALAALQELGIDARDAYREARAQMMEQALFMHSGNFVFSLVALVGMVLGLYFIVRASMISRIYELGVLRALGVRKRTLIGRTLFESFIIATCTSIVGFAAMTYLISRTQAAMGGLLRLGHVSVLSVASGVALLYAVNLFSGYLPLATLLRKKPAEIIAKYDI